MTITSQAGYEIYECGCHEGNNAMRNALAAERAYEKAAEEAKAKGLPRARVRAGQRCGSRALIRGLTRRGSTLCGIDAGAEGALGRGVLLGLPGVMCRRAVLACPVKPWRVYWHSPLVGSEC